MNLKKSIGLYIIIPTLLLTGCAKRPNVTKRLHTINKHDADYQATKNGVTLLVKSLVDPSKKNKIIPLQISINNNTNKYWDLSPHNISLDLASKEEIIQRYKKLPIGAIFCGILGPGYGTYFMAAVIFGLGPVGALLLPPALLYIGITSVLTSRSAKGTRTHNENVAHIITLNGLFDETLVPAKKPHNTLLFVKKSNYQKIFTITLLNHHNPQETIEFSVAM